MFVISDRKVKKEKDKGQTGIDPAHLRSFETSTSAGGYKTNRGESYLVSEKKKRIKDALVIASYQTRLIFFDLCSKKKWTV